MEDKKNCTLIKNKDLEKLREEAAAKKPDYIKATIDLYHYSGRASYSHNAIISNIDLHTSLYSQLRNIIQLVKISNQKMIKLNEEKIFKKIVNMSWWERRKFLKQYKD